MNGMGKAGYALRTALTRHNISQNKLAVALDTSRGTVNHWFSESRDPAAEAIPRIVNALIAINPAAAREFVELYLGRSLEELNNL
jgi:transcriptional regulator with XRE-family HTH domain